MEEEAEAEALEGAECADAGEEVDQLDEDAEGEDADADAEGEGEVGRRGGAFRDAEEV